MVELLTSNQRVALVQHVNNMMQPEFEILAFALDMPPSLMSSSSEAQGIRAIELLKWVRGTNGCGMDEFLEVLNQVAPLPSDISSLALVSKVEITESTSPQTTLAPVTTQQSPSLIPVVALPGRDERIQLPLPNGITLELVHIHSGIFLMGSPLTERERNDAEGPQHNVTISEFYMSKYLVTQEQWYAVSLMDYVDIHLAPTPSKFKKENGPVERVSWEEATEFCKRLSHHVEQLHRYTGQTFRLPSESEWEYACRALTNSPYCFGNNIIAQQSNVRGTIGEPTSVDSYPPNDFGLYDMHGNVREWCLDHWHPNYESAPTDGSAWIEDEENDRRVIRGGSWADAPELCRSASRHSYFPGALSYDLGFRIVLSP